MQFQTLCFNNSFENHGFTHNITQDSMKLVTLDRLISMIEKLSFQEICPRNRPKPIYHTQSYNNKSVEQACVTISKHSTLTYLTSSFHANALFIVEQSVIQSTVLNINP